MKKIILLTAFLLVSLAALYKNSIILTRAEPPPPARVDAIPVLQTAEEVPNNQFRVINLRIENRAQSIIQKGKCYVIEGKNWDGKMVKQQGGVPGQNLCYVEGDPKNPSGPDPEPENLLLAGSNNFLEARWLCTNMVGPRSNCSKRFDRTKFGVSNGYLVNIYEATYKDDDPDTAEDESLHIGEYKELIENLPVFLEETLPDIGELDPVTFNQCDPTEGNDISEALAGGSQGLQTAFGCVPTNVVGFVNKFFQIALGFAGGIAFLLMVFGSYRLMFAGGNPESIQQGREIITAAIAGLVVIITSVFLLRLIGFNILGLPL